MSFLKYIVEQKSNSIRCGEMREKLSRLDEKKINSMGHDDLHMWKQYQTRNFSYETSVHGKCVCVVFNILTILCKNPRTRLMLLCVKLSPAFIQITVKNPFLVSVSNELYEKHLIIYDYCVSTRNSLCSLENFKLHLDLVGASLDQFLQGLDNYIYINQEIHCI